VDAGAELDLVEMPIQLGVDGDDLEIVKISIICRSRTAFCSVISNLVRSNARRCFRDETRPPNRTRFM
jgi:hypothetical protein